MKVVLLQDVRGVGKKFEEKEVSGGYATNFLIPRKLAVPAGTSAAGQVKSLKEGMEKSREKEQQKLAENIAKLADLEIKVALNANEKGHLFAALTKEKIQKLLIKEKGIEINAESINLEHPIKEVGQHRIPVLFGDKETHFMLEVARA